MVTQIPGGILAEKYGGKYVLGIGILLTDFFTMMTPFAARPGGSGAVIAMRVLTGLAEVNQSIFFVIIYLSGILF
jgi:hypothetical protein